jgi:hypothetical protein
LRVRDSEVLPANRYDQSILTEAAAILAGDFKQFFEPLHEQAVRATNHILPSQPNNEIRNFVGHLAEAITAADSSHAQLELIRARRHLYFAVYDSAIIMLLFREAYVIKYVQLIEQKRGNVTELDERLQNITALRRAIPTISAVISDNNASRSTTIELIDKATAASDRMYEVITECNQFALYLESQYASDAPVEFVVPDDLIGELNHEKTHVKRDQALKAVWTYAGSLGVILALVEIVAVRSAQLLLPIAAVCVAGGLIGTFIAVTGTEKSSGR